MKLYPNNSINYMTIKLWSEVAFLRDGEPNHRANRHFTQLGIREA